MSLKSQIVQDMKDAMKARDKPRLEAIRALRAAIQRKEVDERVELDDDAVLTVVKKLIKQGQDSTQQFEQAGRNELAAKERSEIDIYLGYLPEQLSESEMSAAVEAAITELNATGMADMGKVMAKLKGEVGQTADMGQVSRLVKAKLQ